MPYEQGFAAYFRGQRENPHTEQQAAMEWDAGWNDAYMGDR